MLGRVGGSLAALVVLASPTMAQPCPDVALVLSFDASGSIDQEEYAFQLRATADAFRSDPVQEAIRRAGTVAVAAVIWGDAATGSQVIDWHLVARPEDAERVARRLEAEPRKANGNTDLGHGLWRSLDLQQAFEGCLTRRIVNISGDGRETLTPRRRHGASIMTARRRAVQMDVTVNGLAIATEDRALPDYYREEVAAGAGSFVVTVTGWDSFALAMQRKLEREIGPVEVGAVATPGGLKRRRRTRPPTVRQAGRLSAAWRGTGRDARRGRSGA